jgi:hypothetical protein
MISGIQRLDLFFRANAPSADDQIVFPPELPPNLRDGGAHRGGVGLLAEIHQRFIRERTHHLPLVSSITCTPGGGLKRNIVSATGGFLFSPENT